MPAKIRHCLVLAFLAAIQPAAAHPDHGSAGRGAPGMLHLLTEPDHLLPLAAVAGMIAAIAWRVRCARARRRRDDQSAAS